jgi:hypothetical protein
MRRWIILSGVLVLAVLVGIQLVPVDTSNPPVTADVPTSPEVKAVLRRACYDCHSNETTWPWYSRVAPVSWLIAQDVHEGRAELNFSRWDQYSTQQQVKHLKESWEQSSRVRCPRGSTCRSIAMPACRPRTGACYGNGHGSAEIGPDGSRAARHARRGGGMMEITARAAA